MPRARYFAFEPFCLDVLDERLWNDAASVPLGHKAFAVLAELVSHPNQLVTKDDLLATVWPETAVSEAVLTTAMRDIRVAIGDLARTPRFVQTVHGRGYRFIAPVVERSDRAPLPATLMSPSDNHIVGREAEWATLSECYDAIQRGTRRIGLIAGEAGIGKTALVEAFIARVTTANAVRIGRGQCIEQYGAGEAYLPILEALGRLGRSQDESVVRTLRRYAPTWLAHLPWLLSDRVEPPGRIPPVRMLRELTEALEALAASEPLVLVLEDLHWSDSATLEWLAYVARRRDSARLLVLATYRPVEALLRKTPLREVIAELRHHPQTAELVLDYLPRDAVRSYLQQRCGDISAITALADLLHRRTGGHPLFLASIVDELMQRWGQRADSAEVDIHAMAHAIPLNVRQFIEYRFEQLSDEDQSILEAASVAGDPFSVAAVAAGSTLPEAQIEARCAEWTRAHRILIADGLASWPDGTIAARYQFRHAMFHDTAYARVSPERRVRLHARIGGRLETAYGVKASSIAAELAMHFEQGRDLARAVTYLEQAAQNAVRRSAYAEARTYLDRALTMIASLPDDRERLQREATLSLLLAQVLETTKGWGSEAVVQTYSRARELSVVLGDEQRLLQATWGLVAGGIVRAELRKTRALTREVLVLAKKREDSLFRMAAHAELGGIALVLGHSRASQKHFHLAATLYDPRQHVAALATFGMDIGIFARIWSTHLLWQQGRARLARERADETMRAAAASGHPFTHTITLAYAAMLCQFQRDVSEVDRLASVTIAQAAEHGFPYYLAWAEVLRGWSRAAQGAGKSAVDEIRRGITVLQTTARLRLPYYRGLLAEACGKVGNAAEGLEAISEAFHDIGRSEERWWEAELYRIRGELLHQQRLNADAETCLRTAIDVARQQGAKVLELRATVSLARLWQEQRSEKKQKEARRLLADTLGWFSEDLETTDSTDARSLLEELDVALHPLSRSHAGARAAKRTRPATR